MRARGVEQDDCRLVPSAAELDVAGPVSRTVPRPPGLSEQVVVQRRRNLPGVEHWRVIASTRLWREYHERYAFCVGRPVDGSHAWKYRRRTYGLRNVTSTMLIAPGETHVSIHVPLSNFQVVKVEPAVIQRELEEAEPAQGRMHRQFSGGQTDRPVVAARFLALCRALESQSTDAFERRGLLREFLFAALFGDACERPGARTGCERAVDRVCEIVRARCDENLTLEFCERETNVSKHYLERSFRARIGVPIHRYLKLVRLEKAQELLRSGESATHVAHLAGFFDSAHMTRAFGAELGITPGTYARATDGPPSAEKDPSSDS